MISTLAQFFIFLQCSLYAKELSDIKLLDETLVLDNDSLFRWFGYNQGKWYTNEDAWYTHGLSYERRYDNSETSGDSKPLSSTRGFLIGQQMYTPDDLTGEEINRKDRPYASLLYAGPFSEKILDSQIQIKNSILFNVLGPNTLGGLSQNIIHSLSGKAPRARGWKHQIQQELGVQVSQAFTKRISYSSSSQGETSITGSWQIGNIFTDITSSIQVRWGEKLQSLSVPSSLDTRSYFTRLICKRVFYDGTIQGGWFGQYINPSNRAVQFSFF
ncbi:lipid A-modifier LpxR family protein [Deltaproteobacteria bacterium TL4]